MVSDTHAFIWYITASNKLPAKVKKAFDAAIERVETSYAALHRYLPGF
jgi:PIN domain nuclease of toxin-antitoxin system